MPLDAADGRADYGRFPDHIERDWLGRWCHLSEADVALARRRTGDTTRLGFAAQLVTVRAVGTFLSDPTDVPEPIVASVARQLGIADPAHPSTTWSPGVSSTCIRRRPFGRQFIE